MTGAVSAGELLGCPFCGQEGKALIGPISGGAAVCCSNFFCLGQVQAFKPDARRKAIAAWNTRVPATPSPQPVAEVEAREVLARAYERANLTCPAADVRASNKIDWVREAVALDAILSALGGRA